MNVFEEGDQKGDTRKIICLKTTIVKNKNSCSSQKFNVNRKAQKNVFLEGSKHLATVFFHFGHNLA